MAFTAAAAPTTCRPSPLLAPRSSSLRPQALLCSRRPASPSAAALHGRKPVVLFFYPADDSPGCTREIACLGGNTSMPLGSSSPLPSTRHGIQQADDLLSSPNHTPPPPVDGGRTCGLPTWALIGGVTAGVAVALALSGGAGPAMALGPEGPLLEEFWDNMRRYALYALTVSTGFAWALVQPIWDLLRSPVTAVLIVVVIVGGGILVSQVINAMAGNSDFIYMYEQ